MKNKKENLIIKIIVIICLVIALPLLYVNCFFCDFSSRVFNEILGPIVLLLTFIVIYIQLLETREANDMQVSNQEYNSYLNELMEREQRFEKLKFTVEEDIKKLNLNNQYLELIKRIEASNGLNYSSVFSFFNTNKLLPEDNDEKKSINKNLFFVFISSFLFPLQREYDALLNFFNEVNENELMTPKQKKRIFKKAEMDILQLYFEICNNGEYDGYPKSNDLNEMWRDKFDALKYYKVDYFYKINEFYKTKNKNKNLFQYRTLEQYQKPEEKK